MQFQFFRLRFSFEAIDPISFPPGKSSNIVRGAFGTILRKIACTPACTDAAHHPGCVYARIFEPRPLLENTGPSGFRDWPRPFVFRTAHLDGREIIPAARFHFDVHLFDLAHPALSYFVLALSRLASEGLGPRRGLAKLASVEQLDLHDAAIARVFNGENLSSALTPTAVPLNPDGATVQKVSVEFVTPTELKADAGLAERPEFSVLFARIRDRLSTLSALYGPGPLPIDFRAMGERAAAIGMKRCELRVEHVERRSSRTGQVHALGGFTGEAEYTGDLAEFLPYLRAARWSGVGRQTVWGKGEIRVVE